LDAEREVPIAFSGMSVHSDDVLGERQHDERRVGLWVMG
jgi:hypothetical protein